jgi:integrase
MVATSAEWGAVIRTRREDVSEDLAFVRIRGTKRKTRDRVVPIVTKDQGTLLKYALEHAQGEMGQLSTESGQAQLFLDWQNVRRDLRAACAKLEIPRCSPNDLRRTCATWLRAAGTPPHLIAPLMGHADSRMVERVYGRLEPVTLAKLIAKATGSTSANAQQTERDSVDLVDRLDARRSASSSEMAPQRTPI